MKINTTMLQHLFGNILPNSIIFAQISRKWTKADDTFSYLKETDSENPIKYFRDPFLLTKMSF